MILVLIAAALAAGVASLRGGSLENLAATRFRWIWILAAAFIVQVATDLIGYEGLPNFLAVLLVGVSYIGAAAFMGLNRELPGMSLAAVGMALNAIVIIGNGAMPVSQWAARIAGIGELSDMGVKHEVAGPNTVLPWLADVIPIPNAFQIISFGDVVLSVGLSLLVYRQTMARSRAALGEFPVERLK